MRKFHSNLLLLFTLAICCCPAFLQTGWSQNCTLTCIENLQVSLNNNCETTINYRTVLHNPDDPFVCSPNGISAYKIVVMDKDSIPLVSSPKVTCEQVGQTLTVKARHWLTGNSCWSTIKIEDKVSPRLTCEEVVIWCNEDSTPLSEGGKIPVPSVSNICSAECETISYQYEDKTTVFDCDSEQAGNGYVAKIERSWKVCDTQGNCGTCVQPILIRGVNLAEIHLPEDVTSSCTDTCDLAGTSCTGIPTLHDLSLEQGFCNLKVQYEDKEVETCGGSKLVERTWNLLNTCNNDVIEHVQTINIVDNIAPSIICSSETIRVKNSPKPNSCEGVIEVPAATIADCAPAEYISVTTMLYQVVGEEQVLIVTKEGNGGFSYEVPFGEIAIVYTATDDCGNSISNKNNPCVVEISDNLAPTPICNGVTKLSLGADGTGIIYAESLDNGSYDNCCIESFHVRRMDEANSTFEEYIRFSCKDSGTPTMVVLRITDCSENSAICMVEVTADDKNGPSITCPESISYDCNMGISIADITETALGMPSGVDACQTDINYTVTLKEDNRNTCGLGDIVFEWSATDSNGNISTCEQVVSILDRTPYKIQFPLNYKSEECLGELLPSLTGEPIVTGVDCENVVIDYIDTPISDGEYCITINRNWVVKNSCALDGEEEIREHIQVIEVKDTIAPMLDCGVDISVCIENNACDVSVAVAGISVQDCSMNIEARAVWIFTPNENCAGTTLSGEIQNAGLGFTSPKFGPGALMVTFYVVDDCGNQSSCTRGYIIKDCKAPTIACQSGVVLPLDSDGTAVFWASDFDLKSEDNCTQCNENGLNFSFSPNAADGSRLYECQDIGDHPITIYVSDSFGNQTSCETNLIIQSPQGTCDDNTDGGDTDGGDTDGGDTDGGDTDGGDTDGGDTDGGDTDGGDTDGGDTDGGDTDGGDTDGGDTDGGDTDGGDTDGGDTDGGDTDGGDTDGGDTDGGDTDGGDTDGGNSMQIECGSTLPVCILDNTCSIAISVLGVQATSTCEGDISARAYWRFVPNGACNGQEAEGNVNGVMNGFTSQEFSPGTFYVTFTISNNCGEVAICERVYDIKNCDIDGGDIDGGDTDGGDTDGGDMGGSPMGIECGSTTPVCLLESSCSISINVLGIEVTNDCAGDLNTIADWRFVPDPICGGTPLEGRINGAMTGFATPEFGLGTFYVTFTASNNCGEIVSCDRVYEVIDCHKPYAVCLNGITLDLEENGEFEYWGKDFNQNSNDNCGDCSPLYYSFTENIADSSIVFNCNDVGAQSIEIFVTDRAGNQSSCISTFVINKANICGSQKNAAKITGSIVKTTGLEMEGINVMLEDRNRHIRNISETSKEGVFDFEAPLEKDYMLKPEKKDDLLEGVSTYDVVLLRAHILGKKVLDTPYKMIAADINNSGSITTFDLIELRKAILYYEDNFTNNTSYRFLRADQEFSDTKNALKENMEEAVYVDDLHEDMAVDFIAIKIGDISGTVSNLQSSSSRSRTTLNLSATDKLLKEGEIYDLEIAANSSIVEAIQFTLDARSNAGVIISVLENELVQKEHIGLRYADKGLFTLSWNNTVARATTFKYTIRIQAKKDAWLSELLTINSALTPALAYTKEGEEMTVVLNFEQPATSFELLQNVPNPFSKQTTLPFNLPQKSAVKITILNTTGTSMKTIEGTFEKGYNEVLVEKLPTSGLLYYRIETDFGTATGKMLQLK